MHAIYRQNYGFSDLVIGRKHADAPYENGSPIWGDFDAQQVFGELGGDLQLTPCNIGFAAFYESLGRVDLTEKHSDEKPVTVKIGTSNIVGPSEVGRDLQDTFRVRLSPSPSQDVTVQLTALQVNGSDVCFVSNNPELLGALSAQVTVEAGKRTATFTVQL